MVHVEEVATVHLVVQVGIAVITSRFRAYVVADAQRVGGLEQFATLRHDAHAIGIGVGHFDGDGIVRPFCVIELDRCTGIVIIITAVEGDVTIALCAPKSTAGDGHELVGIARGPVRAEA